MNFFSSAGSFTRQLHWQFHCWQIDCFNFADVIVETLKVAEYASSHETEGPVSRLENRIVELNQSFR